MTAYGLPKWKAHSQGFPTRSGAARGPLSAATTSGDPLATMCGLEESEGPLPWDRMISSKEHEVHGSKESTT